MRITHATWHGMDWIMLGAESTITHSAEDATRDLFRRFEETLTGRGLSLDQAVRSRLFGRDRASRDAASEIRKTILAGSARAATSSYIAPDRLTPGALVAMDLLALVPPKTGTKIIRENDPPRLPCRYLRWGDLVVLSGQTAVLPTLEEQVLGNILPRVESYLAEAGSGWNRVIHAACYLHRDEDPDHMRRLYRQMSGGLPPRFDLRPVEGYSAEGKRVEIEITALAGSAPLIP